MEGKCNCERCAISSYDGSSTSASTTPVSTNPGNVVCTCYGPQSIDLACPIHGLRSNRKGPRDEKEDEQVCNTCVHFAPRTRERDPFMNEFDASFGPGWCRRHAPTERGWPRVTWGDWCGDWDPYYSDGNP